MRRAEMTAARPKQSRGGLRTFRTLASFRLHALARLSERFYEQFYRRRFGLSLIECRMIGITGGYGQVSFKRACEDANIDKSHASRLIHRMIRRRLLQKVNNPADQRSLVLALTRTGRETHRALHACATQLAAQWLAVLDEPARTSFEDSLVKLTDRIRAMSDAEARRKTRGAGGRGVPRAARQAGAEPPLPQVLMDRKAARLLYDLLGSALGSEVPLPEQTKR